MPTANAHRFYDTQPTTSADLLRIQLRITPMMPGNNSSVFTPNLPSSDDKAFHFFKIHFLKPFSSFGGGLPPATVPPPPGSNALTKTPIAIPITVSMEAIVILCSRKSVQIFSDNEVSLFKTLAIVSLKLVIWSFSLPLRRSMQVVIQLDGSFSNVFPNSIIVFWIVSDFLKLMLFFLDSSFQLNLFCHFHLYQTPNTLLVLVPKQILLLQG